MNSNALRGDGLFVVHRALAALEEDPQRLERARMRLSDPPPSYRSHQSHNSTRSQSPNPPSDEQRCHEERKWKLIREHRASRPYEQLEAQRSEEEAWLVRAERNGTRPQPVDVDFYKLAYETVRERWEEQGNWNDKWNDMADGLWKHEESEPELDVDMEAEAYTPKPIFRSLSQEPEPRLKSDEDKRQIAEQQAKQARHSEASRPFHQFVYQISTERGRIQEESRDGAAALSTPAEINTIAYKRVRAAWIKRKIWNDNWGTLPGMSWKHEDPLAVDVANTANEPVPVDASGASFRSISTSPVPANLNHQGSIVTTTSWQGSLADVHLHGLENRDPMHPPSESNSSLLTAEQSVRGRSSKPSRKNNQNRVLGNMSLDLKNLTRKRTGSQRPRRALKGAAPPSPRPDVAGPLTQPAGILPRRSPRLQTSKLGLADGLDGKGTVGRSKGTSRTRLQRSAANSAQVVSSAKPRGVLKRRSRTTR